MNRVPFLVVALACSLSLVQILPARGPAPAEQELQQLLQEAQKFLDAQKLDEAVAVLKKATKLAPNSDKLFASISDLERQTGKYADGIEHALQAIKLNDKVPTYYLLVAINAYNLQDLDRAREYCDLVLKRGGKELDPAVFKDATAIAALLTKQTYTINWTLDPQKGRQATPNSSLVVTLPKTDLPYQTATYEVTGAQSFRIEKKDANDILHLVPKGKQTIHLTTKVTVVPYSYKKQLAKAAPGPLPAGAREFLGASESIDPKSPVLVKLVAGLKGSNDEETARNILEWLRKNIKYRLQKASIGEVDFKTMEEIVERGHAECRGYTLLFTALCRAAGVPARPVWGLAKLPGTESNPKGAFASHNWCEVYVNGCGWVPVDPQKPESFGLQPNTNLRFFMDEKKSKSLLEILPMINLILMNGETIKFE